MTNSHSASADASSKAMYSKYDMQTDQWTNVSIFPNSYSVSSDNVLYDQLYGEFVFSPWELIMNKAEDESFFTMNIPQSESQIELKIDYLDKSNTVSFANNITHVQGLVEILDNIHKRVTGGFNEVYYWPTDISVAVMESYPEQYGVTALIQMANGLFSYVPDGEVTLIVADYDIYAQYLVDPNGNITHVSKENFTLGNGGEIAEIQFDTFFGSVDFRPSELYFFVVLDNGMYLKTSSFDLPVVGHSGIDISDYKPNQPSSSNTDGENSDGLQLPINYFWFTLPLIAIPLIRKQRK